MNRILLSGILFMLSTCFMLGCTTDLRIWGVWREYRPVWKESWVDEESNHYLTYESNGTWSAYDLDTSCLLAPECHHVPPFTGS